MTGWAVLDALGVGLAVLLLAWTLLLYVPFRWRPMGLYLFVPKLAAGALTRSSLPPGCWLPWWAGWWLLVDGRAGRARRRGGLHRGGAAGPGACRPDRGSRPRLGRADPDPASGEDGGPLVARAATHRPCAAAAPGRRLRHGAGHRPQLRCDLWQPPAEVPASGLAVVYLHGGAWYVLDKDVGTRPLFRHLAPRAT